MERFCSILNKILCNKLFTTFTNEFGFEGDNNIPSFVSLLKKIINNDKLLEDLKVHYYYYNLFNHPSLSIIHALAKKGKIPAKILSIKTIPPYPSYIFSQAYQK